MKLTEKEREALDRIVKALQMPEVRKALGERENNDEQRTS